MYTYSACYSSDIHLCPPIFEILSLPLPPHSHTLALYSNVMSLLCTHAVYNMRVLGSPCELGPGKPYSASHNHSLHQKPLIVCSALCTLTSRAGNWQLYSNEIACTCSRREKCIADCYAMESLLMYVMVVELETPSKLR